jgi:hypothetical protein
VSAVVLNVTATETQSGGYLTVWPSGAAQPLASSLNYERAGETVPNHVLVPVGADGRVRLFTSTGTHLIADVGGYFTDSTAPQSTQGLFVPVTPLRVLDSRYGYGGFYHYDSAGTHELPLGGVGQVPADNTAAVVGTFTIVNPEGPGFGTVWPTGAAQPNASNMNYEFAGQTRANLVSVAAPGGAINAYLNTRTDLIADVAGYYTSR